MNGIQRARKLTVCVTKTKPGHYALEASQERLQPEGLRAAPREKQAELFDEAELKAKAATAVDED